MNTPNILTISRIILTFVFIFLYKQNTLQSYILALVVFTLASLTDYFDGYLARKHNLISLFGKIMDPIADKFLTLSAFFIFTQLHVIALWMFIVIAIREVAVTGLRLMAMRRGAALAAEEAGKLKTVLQIVSIYLIMIFTIIAVQGAGLHVYLNAINGLMWVVVIATLWSGLLFIWNNRKEIFSVR